MTFKFKIHFSFVAIETVIKLQINSRINSSTCSTIIDFMMSATKIDRDDRNTPHSEMGATNLEECKQTFWFGDTSNEKPMKCMVENMAMPEMENADASVDADVEEFEWDFSGMSNEGDQPISTKVKAIDQLGNAVEEKVESEPPVDLKDENVNAETTSEVEEPEGQGTNLLNRIQSYPSVLYQHLFDLVHYIHTIFGIVRSWVL